VTRRFGEKLLGKIKHLFRTWDRRDQMPAERWNRAAEQAKRAVLKVARRPPRGSEAQNIGERFRQHSEHYFRFLATPGVEPNKAARLSTSFTIRSWPISPNNRLSPCYPDLVNGDVKPQLERKLAAKEAEIEAILDGFAGLTPKMKDRINKRLEALQIELDALRRDLNRLAGFPGSIFMACWPPARKPWSGQPPP